MISLTWQCDVGIYQEHQAEMEEMREIWNPSREWFREQGKEIRMLA